MAHFARGASPSSCGRCAEPLETFKDVLMRIYITIAAFLMLAPSAFAQIGASTSSDADETPESTDASPPATAPRSSDAAAEPASAPRASASPAGELGGPYVLDRAPSIGAAAGLFRTYQATGLEPGTFGLSLMTEYFGGSDVVRQEDRTRRFIGHLSFSWTPIEHLEVFVQMHGRATTNTLGNPELIQSIGDTRIGLKGFGEIIPGLHLGGLLAFQAPAGANTVGLDFSAFSLDIIAIATADLRALADVPLRFHLNVGYLLDRSERLFPFILERVERFGHHVHDYDRVLLGLGIDVPIDYVTPRLEWRLEIPNGAPCDSGVLQPCVTDNGFSAYPHWLTIGAATAPFMDDLAFHAGLDLAITTKESQGTPAVPGWNLMLGMSYNLNPRGQVVVVEPPVMDDVAPAAATGMVVGRIVDAETGAPLEGVIIRYADATYTSQITGPDGRFRTFDFPIGAGVTLEIEHPAYVTRSFEVTITETPREGTIELVPDFTGTRLSGTVTSSAGRPVAATITLQGPDAQTIETNADGTYVVDVEPGAYRVFVSAPGFAGSAEALTLEPGRVESDMTLSPLAAGQQLRFVGTELGTDDADAMQIFDGAGLSPAADDVLDELAALLARESGVRVRVVAHTDDQEDPVAEQELTEARAQEVVDALVDRGVERNRLRAQGAGATAPLVPNISDRDRRRNNRVQFVVVP